MKILQKKMSAFSFSRFSSLDQYLSYKRCGDVNTWLEIGLLCETQELVVYEMFCGCGKHRWHVWLLRCLMDCERKGQSSRKSLSGWSDCRWLDIGNRSCVNGWLNMRNVYICLIYFCRFFHDNLDALISYVSATSCLNSPTHPNKLFSISKIIKLRAVFQKKKKPFAQFLFESRKTFRISTKNILEAKSKHPKRHNNR